MTDLPPLSIALILGSGPTAPRLQNWPKPANVSLVAINNAWRVRADWDYLIHAGDFPATRMPDRLGPGQRVHSHESYVPAQNSYGGFVYGGGTMAFTAGYWALAVLKPDILAYYACDMTYCGNVTHFYGAGTADPLRPDVTLQSLEAKSIRLMALAALQGCACINLSTEPSSRLSFPRVGLSELGKQTPEVRIDADAVEAALREEARLGYLIEDGEYWRHTDRFDACALSSLDDLWLSACSTPELEKRFA
ncbi:MAG: hypothetical protein KUA43_13430 [Hoeflea sp.]|uniref:hypothetical protein n=1 Tax=Hoeflea sp. TaxID=1940281 RepID=UPI001D6BD75B|nr:hypothetical protein [Hoeflea sp.]MBU4531160.1 hypothetical protein [Alphaproteobacteria bacterium]MBU4545778.1 hypothetical protein [Alphaproteobacteria bacterium]MBU4550747.1 hypothetical protein [Alphaproteobacteria bacterium]MBV1724437.1 hypothetical protein [Hoeflea sp.]MBV1760457.1 hypothetical protein [Hoeflea sp.]